MRIDDVTVKLKGPKMSIMSKPLNNVWKTFILDAECGFLVSFFNLEKFSFSSSISQWGMQSFSFVEKLVPCRHIFLFFFKHKIYCYIFCCVSQLAAKKTVGKEKKSCFNTIFFETISWSLLLLLLWLQRVCFLWLEKSVVSRLGEAFSQNLVHLLFQ